MKVYISGAISDNPNYKEQFDQAAKRLKDKGHDVVNPALHVCDTYKEYMDVALFRLMNCDAIYMLDGWEPSKGANLELTYAITVGLTVL